MSEAGQPSVTDNVSVTPKKTKTKEVLVIFRDRRRPIVYKCCDESLEEYQCILESVKETFADVLFSEEGPSSGTSFHLQRDSKVWGRIDLSSREKVENCSILYMQLLKESMNESNKKAKDICQRIGKPSEANAKTLASLFPTLQNRKRKFDPNDECVVAEQHRKKKAGNPAAKRRAKNLKVVVLAKEVHYLPKGQARDKLAKSGRIKEIPMRRNMTPTQVTAAIINNFSIENSSAKLLYLQGHRDNTLTVCKEQIFDGVGIIQLAGSGSVYVTLKESVSRSRSPSPLSDLHHSPPSSPVNSPNSDDSVKHSLQRATEAIAALQSTHHSGDSDLVVVSSDEDETKTEIAKTELRDRRRLIEEQDAEYQLSLHADIAKETEKKMKEEFQKKIKELQCSLKLKFSHVCSDRVNVAFRLPNSNKIEYCFSRLATIKDMYQCVLSNDVSPPFTLSLAHPPRSFPLESMSCDSVVPFSNTLVIVTPDEERPCVLDMFEDTVVVDSVGTETKDPESLDMAAVSAETQESLEMLVCTEPIQGEGDSERVTFLKLIQAVQGFQHEIDRENVYEDVINLYRKGDIINEYPIAIAFVGEIAIDIGGVQRDMYSAFWEKAYTSLFDGATLLTPMFHPQTDMSVFPVIGSILSHGFLVTGLLPDRIAVPTLTAMLLGLSAPVSPEVLLDTFLDFISSHERSVFKRALGYVKSTSFPADLQEELMSCLSRFGCRVLPTPSKFVDIIEQTSRYEFVTKPAAGISMINSGIPTTHRQFWSRKSPADIQTIYNQLTLTPEKVFSLFQFADFASPQESRIAEYLKVMIGNMHKEELRRFMRFVTGCCVCNAKQIKIDFNGLTGFGRRPIAHTCDCTLELPTSYINFEDFQDEFASILSKINDEYSWQIDAI